jgi:hypothetical protein
MSDDWPIAGTLLAARYRLAERLETGGMADIWRAQDELLGRPVAVKLPTGAQVAWREARMGARLSHPSIAAVHDYREAVRPDGTVAPFVVMELLGGETVAARLVRDPLPLDEAARIGAAVADALAAAHTNGVVHRDIKPGNVMLTPTGVKILDFGISAPAGEPDEDDTGATFGTPAYVAPERLDGMPAVPATDVYGLGVLLFEMVTGEPPYPVDTWEELADARSAGPGELPASLPLPFRTLVSRCLDDDPASRPAAEEVRFDLTALWLTGAPETAPAAIPSSASAATSPPASASATEAPVAYASGRVSAATLPMTRQPDRRLAVTLALVALLVAVGGTVTLVNWPRKGVVDAGSEPTGRPTVVLPPGPPATSPPAVTAPAPAASPTPKLTYADAVSRVRSAVEDGAADGEIRADVATDLLNLIRPLSASEGKDVGDQVAQLRRKVRERLGEGSLQPARAEVLQSRLADLDRAAGT